MNGWWKRRKERKERERRARRESFDAHWEFVEELENKSISCRRMAEKALEHGYPLISKEWSRLADFYFSQYQAALWRDF